MELGHDKAAKWGHLQASKMGSWSLANRYGLKKGSGGFSKGGGQSLFKECLSSSLASPFSHSFVHQQNCAKYLAGVEQRTRGSPGRHHGEEVKRERVSLRKEQLAVLQWLLDNLGTKLKLTQHSQGIPPSSDCQQSF